MKIPTDRVGTGEVHETFKKKRGDDKTPVVMPVAAIPDTATAAEHPQQEPENLFYNRAGNSTPTPE